MALATHEMSDDQTKKIAKTLFKDIFEFCQAHEEEFNSFKEGLRRKAFYK